MHLLIERSLLDVLSRIAGDVTTHKILRGLKHKSLLLKVTMCLLATLKFIKHALTIIYVIVNLTGSPACPSVDEPVQK